MMNYQHNSHSEQKKEQNQTPQANPQIQYDTPKNQEKPMWGTVVGILGIIFGALGTLNSINLFAAPMMLDMQKNMLHSIEMIHENNSEHNDELETVASIYESMFSVPEWYGTFTIFFAFLFLGINIIYIIGSIFLLQLKKIGVDILIYTMAGSIVLSLIYIIINFMYASGIMGVGMSMNKIFGIIIDVVLIIFVIMGDKTAFSARKTVSSKIYKPFVK